MKNNGKERACPWRNCNLGRNDCLKLDGKESRKLGDREMSTILPPASCDQCMRLSPDAFAAQTYNFELD